MPAKNATDQPKRLTASDAAPPSASPAVPPAPPDLPPAGPPDAARRLATMDRATKARIEHGPLVTAALYEAQLKGVVGDDPVLASARSFVIDLVDRVRPRDPLEEMPLAQMLQTHARVAYLNTPAHRQKSLDWSAQFHDAADRAANTFRRQLLALAEHRSPRPPKGQPSNVTQIAQANIASQQVVQQVNRAEGAGRAAVAETKSATNEQGCGGSVSRGIEPDAELGDANAGSPFPRPALPAVAGRAGGPEGGRGGDPAVVPEHRPADAGGQGPVGGQRPAARAAVGGRRRSSAGRG